MMAQESCSIALEYCEVLWSTEWNRKINLTSCHYCRCLRQKWWKEGPTTTPTSTIEPIGWIHQWNYDRPFPIPPISTSLDHKIRAKCWTNGKKLRMRKPTMWILWWKSTPTPWTIWWQKETVSNNWPLVSPNGLKDIFHNAQKDYLNSDRRVNYQA